MDYLNNLSLQPVYLMIALYSQLQLILFYLYQTKCHLLLQRLLNLCPYQYMRLFKEYRPTFISLVPRHHEILSRTKGWNELDMSCVRYMVTGSSIVSQAMIDEFLSKGVKTVANWYGMTEMPPPVLIGYNTAGLNLTNIQNGYDVNFTQEGQCIINGLETGDIFDLETGHFLKRKQNANGQTWKSNV